MFHRILDKISSKHKRIEKAYFQHLKKTIPAIFKTNHSHQQLIQEKDYIAKFHS